MSPELFLAVIISDDVSHPTLRGSEELDFVGHKTEEEEKKTIEKKRNLFHCFLYNT
jgi:hypothetical protein